MCPNIHVFGSFFLRSKFLDQVFGVLSTHYECLVCCLHTMNIWCVVYTL